MKKTLAHEARDQGLHVGLGFGLSLAFAFIGIGLVWLPLIIFGLAIIREWVQHKSIYIPRGGSLVDIIFFVVGSFVTCLIIGGIIWMQKT